jgi:hypothetical protein
MEHAMPVVEVDAYVLDTLMADLVGHDRQPSAFLVYLFLWRHTRGANEPTAQVSLSDIVIGTGLSKRAVQAALGWLSKRRLLSVQRESITAIPCTQCDARGRGDAHETAKPAAPASPLAVL